MTPPVPDAVRGQIFALKGLRCQKGATGPKYHRFCTGNLRTLEEKIAGNFTVRGKSAEG